jgi:DNA replication licensing factor MCM5
MDGSGRPIVLQPPEDIDGWERGNLNHNYNVEGSSARHRFKDFFRNFCTSNVYTYREALLRQWNKREFFVEVDVAHMSEYDDALLNSLQTNPGNLLPFFEAGAKDALELLLVATNRDVLQQEGTFPDFQIILKSAQLTQSLRNLTAEHVNKLIKVPGIVISASRTRSKAFLVVAKCTKCQTVKKIACSTAMEGTHLPTKCDRDGRAGDDCGPGTFVIMSDKCKYIDQQTLKLQESPEVVPTGEMPRNIMLTVDRYLVDRITPGTRVSVLGIASLFTSAANASLRSGSGNTSIRTPYLKVIGVQIESEGGGRADTVFTPSEEVEMERLARDPQIYEKIASSIAPQISGDYTVDIKKALACLLMGGSRKVLPDGVRLRGDINVLLMGDPSTAKSQFLKFIERVSPVGVYTSGKGSSAAGLTATVIKDAKGEFFLEGGSMVLADGGVICIDEFDKMKEQDRVAIHEAMEQQTISIAKAGITTVLNCRTAVLAAANPIYGRYDDLKSVGENIDLMTTILSRFDCIFVVRDVRDQERDKSIARHVLGVHINSSMLEQSSSTDISPSTLKKFISYCRIKCAPRLSDEAAAMLGSHYVQIRNKVRESLLNKPGESQVVPITVRQLEALIRLSESLAKMRLASEATVSDVEEAMRLFKVSTLQASQASPMLMGAMTGAANTEMMRVEEYLKRRMGLRITVSTKKVLDEALAQGFGNDAVMRCIMSLVSRNELQELNQGKVLKRIR